MQKSFGLVKKSKINAYLELPHDKINKTELKPQKIIGQRSQSKECKIDTSNDQL